MLLHAFNKAYVPYMYHSCIFKFRIRMPRHPYYIFLSVITLNDFRCTVSATWLMQFYCLNFLVNSPFISNLKCLKLLLRSDHSQPSFIGLNLCIEVLWQYVKGTAWWLFLLFKKQATFKSSRPRPRMSWTVDSGGGGGLTVLFIVSIGDYPFNIIH